MSDKLMHNPILLEHMPYRLMDSIFWQFITPLSYL